HRGPADGLPRPGPSVADRAASGGVSRGSSHPSVEYALAAWVVCDLAPARARRPSACWFKERRGGALAEIDDITTRRLLDRRPPRTVSGPPWGGRVAIEGTRSSGLGDYRGAYADSGQC